MKVQLTTTFEQLYDASPCLSRYRHLAKALGGIKKYGRTKPINLLTILEHNGLGDFFWTLHKVIDHQIARVIRAEGEDWWTKMFWDMESTATREERIVSIRRYLK